MIGLTSLGATANLNAYTIARRIITAATKKRSDSKMRPPQRENSSGSKCAYQEQVHVRGGGFGNDKHLIGLT